MDNKKRCGQQQVTSSKYRSVGLHEEKKKKDFLFFLLLSVPLLTSMKVTASELTGFDLQYFCMARSLEGG